MTQYTLPLLPGKQPYAWQKECLDKLVPLHYGAVLGEVGTGKSAAIIYILGAKYLAKEIDAVLLLAPGCMYDQWVKEQLPEHCGVPYTTHLWDSASARNKREASQFIKEPSSSLKFLVVNIEALSHETYLSLFKGYLKTHKSALVVDEATYIKNSKSNRTENVIYGLNDLLRYGKIVADLSYTSVYRAILTGTVVTNHPYDLYSMYTFLDKNFWHMPENAFKKRYGIRRLDEARNRKFYKNLTKEDIRYIRTMLNDGCITRVICESQGVSPEDVEYIKAHPSMTLPWKHLDELKQKIDFCSFSINLSECFDIVPVSRHIVLHVKMSTEQKRVYSQVRNNLLARFGSKQLTVTTKAAVSMACQRITGGFASVSDIMDPDAEKELYTIDKVPTKYQVLKEDMENVGEYPVLVFCRFVAEAEYIATHLSKDIEGIRCGLIIGKVPKEERQKLIAKFKNGEMDVLVANPECLGIGQNLQRSHIEYLYSIDFSSEHLNQTFGRIRRATQEADFCIYKHLSCDGSVDEHIQQVQKDKKDLLEYFQEHSLAEVI